MSDPNDTIFPPSSDDAQKTRNNRKGVRPKQPTLELTAVTIAPDTPEDAPRDSEASADSVAVVQSVQNDRGATQQDDVQMEKISQSAGEKSAAPLVEEQEKVHVMPEKAQSESEKAPSEQKRSGVPGVFLVLAAGIAGGAVVYGLTTLLPQNMNSTATDNTAAFEERLAKLEQTASAQSGDAGQQDVAALVERRLAAMNNRTAQDAAATTAKLEQADQQLAASVESIQTQLEGIKEQMAALAAQSSGSPQAGALQEEINELEKRLNTALAENQRQLTLNRSGGLILEIERALRYGRPFDAPLQQLKAVVPNLDTTALEPYAKEGVSRMHVLAAQMQNLLNSTPYEAVEGMPEATENLGLWQQIRQSAASLVRVTPVAEISPESPRADLKAALESEDWPAVLKKQQKLDNAAYTATREVAASLAARLEAEKALAALNTQLYSAPVIGSQPAE